MSQLRKHLRFSLRVRLRSLYLKKKLGRLGKKTYVERNVRFLRFPKNIFIANNIVIKEGARLCSCNQEAKIFIGENTTIGYHSFIFSSKEIRIGDNCLIAPFVYLVDSDHGVIKDLLINQQPNTSLPICIGNDVWIASNVTILKGTIIENGAVIAANSVVNSNVPAYEIWGGSPAKKIGERK